MYKLWYYAYLVLTYGNVYYTILYYAIFDYTILYYNVLPVKLVIFAHYAYLLLTYGMYECMKYDIMLTYLPCFMWDNIL